MARASLFHGMTRVYQQFRQSGATPTRCIRACTGQLVRMDFVSAAGVFLPDRTALKACLLIGLYRGDAMMLNPVGGEAGPLRAGDELIFLSQQLPDLRGYSRPTPPNVGGLESTTVTSSD